MIKSIGRSLVVLLLGAAVLWAGDPWKEKPYAEWSLKETAKVSRNSPWAHSVSILSAEGSLQGPNRSSVPQEGDDRMARMGNPGGSIGGGSQPAGARRRTRFIVQWASSLTVRQALVRQQQLRGSVDEEQARQFLARRPEQYVIIVLGPEMKPFQELGEDEVRQSAYLQPRHSKKKILPERIQFIRRGTRLVAVEFYFPRHLEEEPVLGPQEKKVRFYCQSNASAVSTDFNLRKMTREGEPDL
ncbi:MAG: hypothetical protein ACE5IP_00350 [Terriglobia bacterium]